MPLELLLQMLGDPMSLSEAVKGVIKDIINDYTTKEKEYLTEGDIVSTLFSKLKNCLENVGIHAQLRPYRKNGQVIREDGEWGERKTGNWGSVVDIAVVNENFWPGVREKHKDRKYWRMPSWPVEAFLAAIEVKARVSGNLPRIRKDIDKLLAIKKENPNCLLYVVMMDKKAPEIDRKEIQEYAERKRVPFISSNKGS